MLGVVFAACPESASFFGFMGATAAITLSNLGAGYGTAKAGVGVASAGVLNEKGVMKNIIPVVMAGVLGIYGLIVAIIILGDVKGPNNGGNYSMYNGFAHLCAGLSVGVSCLGAGMAIGIVGDAGVRANSQVPKLFIPMMLMLIFAETLAIYGLISGIIMSQKKWDC